jgi:hypothetical protein
MKMKILFENWRKFVNEVTTLEKDIKKSIFQAIVDSKFWTKQHKESDVDLVGETDSSTPAIEHLMDDLNDAAKNLGTDLYFHLTVTDEEEYTLGPDSPYPGYPDNWLMQGQYRGPSNRGHVIWIEFRPISEDFEMDEFNPDNLVKTLSQTINHEIVHYEQLKKQAANKGISDEEAWEELLNDPKQLSQSDSRADYITLHNEVDAFAHEAAEQLLDKFSPDEALQLIKVKDKKLFGVVRDYIDVLESEGKGHLLKKFWTKLYLQIQAEIAGI